MIDDGQVVQMNQDEYDLLVGRITRMFHGGDWTFPWQGRRSILVLNEPHTPNGCKACGSENCIHYLWQKAHGDLFNKLVSENKVQELSIPFGIQI